MSPPIFTPDGSEVSEIVLPDGSTASQVIGPDGNVVFEAPPDIPDSGNLRNNYDLREVAVANGNQITSISDQAGTDGLSGNAAMDTGGINNQNTAVHDGADDNFVTTFASSVSQPYEFFIICRLRDLNDNYGLIDGDNRAEGYLRVNGSQWQLYAGGTGQSGGTADTNVHIFNLRFDDANSDTALVVDGGSPDIGPLTGAGTASRGGHTIASLGDGAQDAALDWGQMVFFNDKLSSSERNEWGNYLAYEWGQSWADV